MQSGKQRGGRGKPRPRQLRLVGRSHELGLGGGEGRRPAGHVVLLLGLGLASLGLDRLESRHDGEQLLEGGEDGLLVLREVELLSDRAEGRVTEIDDCQVSDLEPTEVNPADPLGPGDVEVATGRAADLDEPSLGLGGEAGGGDEGLELRGTDVRDILLHEYCSQLEWVGHRPGGRTPPAPATFSSSTVKYII